MKLILFKYMRKNKVFIYFILGLVLASASYAFIPGSENKFTELLKEKISERFSKTSYELPDWALADPKDGYEGTRTLAFREYIKNSGKTINSPKPVVVAVIDGGIDINHPALKNNIWQNLAEVNGQHGVDDDGNGYIDDFNGWNFLGTQENLGLEVTREYFRLKKEGVPVSDSYYIKVKDEYTNEKSEVMFMRVGINSSVEEIENAERILKERNYPTDPEKLQKISNNLTGKYEEAASVILNSYFLYGVKKDELLELQKEYNIKAKFINDSTSTHFYIGDNPNLFVEKGYGNNKPNTGQMDHATHVAGIIAANVSTIGQSPYAQIMCLRAVPDEGDERDKDVANAIYYAVDNGASIINMSAGKYFSPQPEKVVQAIKYAEEKGVVFVSSAGNESSDIEDKINFPRKFVMENGQMKFFSNMIVVGASTWMKEWSQAKDPEDFAGRFDLAASFSNYSDRVVDVFAPGLQINSSYPNPTYKKLDGTSMSAPEVSGVAANLKAYFPNLTAAQIKEIIVSSARTYPGLNVKVKGKNSRVPFSELSKSGGVVDMLNAYKRAYEFAQN
ncbi:MAG: S8 family serine peptidase [Bacteroidetes bacterium]|nr:S8 family serine peptidase [Bacteroidota bacterium]